MSPVDINPTQAIILAVLHQGKAPGSRVEAESNKLHGHWNVTRSQIYRELPVLARLGLVQPVAPGDEWRGSEPYEITHEGKRAYAEWFANKTILPITRDPWILRQRLSAYTGISDQDRQHLMDDAIECVQIDLAKEKDKDYPDPLLVHRYEAMLAWFSGSLS